MNEATANRASNQTATGKNGFHDSFFVKFVGLFFCHELHELHEEVHTNIVLSCLVETVYIAAPE